MLELASYPSFHQKQQILYETNILIFGLFPSSIPLLNVQCNAYTRITEWTREVERFAKHANYLKSLSRKHPFSLTRHSMQTATVSQVVFSRLGKIEKSTFLYFLLSKSSILLIVLSHGTIPLLMSTMKDLLIALSLVLLCIATKNPRIVLPHI